MWSIRVLKDGAVPVGHSASLTHPIAHLAWRKLQGMQQSTKASYGLCLREPIVTRLSTAGCVRYKSMFCRSFPFQTCWWDKSCMLVRLCFFLLLSWPPISGLTWWILDSLKKIFTSSYALGFVTQRHTSYLYEAKPLLCREESPVRGNLQWINQSEVDEQGLSVTKCSVSKEFSVTVQSIKKLQKCNQAFKQTDLLYRSQLSLWWVSEGH